VLAVASSVGVRVATRQAREDEGSISEAPGRDSMLPAAACRPRQESRSLLGAGVMGLSRFLAALVHSRRCQLRRLRS